MLKRILLLAIASALGATASAQTVSVGSLPARCGEQVSVPVTVDSVSGMLSLEFRIAYDTARLTPAAALTGSLTSGFSISSNSSGGVLRVALASGSPVSGSGVVAMLPFSVAGNATGTSSLAISNVLINDNARSGNAGAVDITCLQPPAAPVLVSPANGAAGLTPPVTLRWNGVSGASSYRVYFGTQSLPPLVTTTAATSADVSTDPGTTYYWMIDAVNGAGTTRSATWSFLSAGTSCPTPAAPLVNAPAEVVSGSSFEISWGAVAGATAYVVEESSSPAFATPTSTMTTATRLSLTRSAATETSLYFRVHAINAATPCNMSGTSSAVVAIRVVPRPALAPGTRVVPVVGATAGSLGSFFRTAVQLHNPTSQTLSGRLVFHPQGAEGSGADPVLPYSVAANQTTSFRDVVVSLGLAQAIGSLDIVPDANGSAPLTAVHVFNDGGAAGTTGMNLDQLGLADAIQAGQRGILIAPITPAGSRMNIGIRTLLDGVTMTVTIRARDGFMVQSTRRSYPQTYFIQLPLADFTGGSVLLGDEAVIIDVESGSALVYGAVTDNLTQDPRVQIARPVQR